MWNDQDLKQMAAKGIATAQIDRQLARFAQGFPWLRIKSVATVEDGIVRLTAQQQSRQPSQRLRQTAQQQLQTAPQSQQPQMPKSPRRPRQRQQARPSAAVCLR